MGMPGRRRAPAGPQAPPLQGITVQGPATMLRRVSQNREITGFLLRFEDAGVSGASTSQSGHMIRARLTREVVLSGRVHLQR
jgi:hypothetical protein